MSIFIALVVGGVAGWVGSMLAGSGREDLIKNVMIGIGGAYLGGWILNAVASSTNPGAFTFGAVIASTLGAAALLLLARRLLKA